MSSAELPHEFSENGSARTGSNPLVMAYEVGRVLARLSFFAQQAWLGRFGHAAQVEELFEELQLMARNVAPLEARDHLQQYVQERLQEWQHSLQSMWRGDALFEENRHLRANLTADNFQASRTRACQRLTDTVTDLINRVRHAVEEGLDDHGRMALGLGMCVEQGQCPRDAHCHWYRRQDEPPPESASGRWTSDTASPRTSSGTFQYEDYLTGGTIHVGELPPEPTWFAEIRQRCAEMGISEDLWPPQSAGQPSQGGVVAVVEDLHTSLRRVLDEVFGSRPGQSRGVTGIETGYLGIVLYEQPNDLQVGRNGMTERARFGGHRLWWEILRRLIRNRENRTLREQLRPIWESVGREPAPSNGTMDDAISEVRRLLAPLQITIPCSRRAGWMLEAVDASRDNRANR